MTFLSPSVSDHEQKKRPAWDRFRGPTPGRTLAGSIGSHLPTRQFAISKPSWLAIRGIAWVNRWPKADPVLSDFHAGRTTELKKTN